MISSPYSSHPVGTFISSSRSLLTWDASNLAILKSNLANLEEIYPLWSVSANVFLIRLYVKCTHAYDHVETFDFVLLLYIYIHMFKLLSCQG